VPASPVGVLGGAKAFVGTESCLAAFEFLEENLRAHVNAARDVASAGRRSSSPSTSEASVRVTVLSYNHLLKGKDHKKEKELVDAAK